MNNPGKNLIISHLDEEDNLSWWDRRSRWLDVEYYKYLFRIPSQEQGDHPLGWDHNIKVVDYAYRVWCRFRGHPSGQVYYNPSGYEPDCHCAGCGDEI